MYCTRCGHQMDEGQRYCSSCGAASGGVAAAVPAALPPENRLAGHLRFLAICWIAVSAIRLLPGIFLIVIFGSAVHFYPPEVPAFVPAIAQLVGVLLCIGAALGVVTGWGLWERREWARPLTTVLAFFSLFDVPIGTVLGVYTLWLLLPERSTREYQLLAQEAN
jgi:hypothetical protein